jgi:hypothetical protein
MWMRLGNDDFIERSGIAEFRVDRVHVIDINRQDRVAVREELRHSVPIAHPPRPFDNQVLPSCGVLGPVPSVDCPPPTNPEVDIEGRECVGKVRFERGLCPRSVPGGGFGGAGGVRGRLQCGGPEMAPRTPPGPRIKAAPSDSLRWDVQFATDPRQDLADAAGGVVDD